MLDGVFSAHRAPVGPCTCLVLGLLGLDGVDELSEIDAIEEAGCCRLGGHAFYLDFAHTKAKPRFSFSC